MASTSSTGVASVLSSALPNLSQADLEQISSAFKQFVEETTAPELKPNPFKGNYVSIFGSTPSRVRALSPVALRSLGVIRQHMAENLRQYEFSRKIDGEYLTWFIYELVKDNYPIADYTALVVFRDRFIKTPRTYSPKPLSPPEENQLAAIFVGALFDFLLTLTPDRVETYKHYYTLMSPRLALSVRLRACASWTKMQEVLAISTFMSGGSLSKKYGLDRPEFRTPLWMMHFETQMLSSLFATPEMTSTMGTVADPKKLGEHIKSAMAEVPTFAFLNGMSETLNNVFASIKTVVMWFWDHIKLAIVPMYHLVRFALSFVGSKILDTFSSLLRIVGRVVGTPVDGDDDFPELVMPDLKETVGPPVDAGFVTQAGFSVPVLGLRLSKFFVSQGMNFDPAKWQVKGFDRAQRDTDSLFSWIIETYLSVFGSITPEFVTEALVGNSRCVEVREWYSNVDNIFRQDATRTLPLDYFSVDRIHLLLLQGRGFLEKSVNLSLGALVPILSRSIAQLETLEKEYVSRVSTSSLTRPRPVVLMLHGETGHGKSNLSLYLAKVLAADTIQKSGKDFQERMAAYKANARSEIFVMGDDKYYDGLSPGQSVGLYDDFDQRKPQAGDEMSLGSQFVKSNNEAVYTPRMSAIRDKNNVQLRFCYSIYSTNSDHFYDPGMTSVAAAERRIDFNYEVERVKRDDPLAEFDPTAYVLHETVKSDEANGTAFNPMSPWRRTGTKIDLPHLFQAMVDKYAQNVKFFKSTDIDPEVALNQMRPVPKNFEEETRYKHLLETIRADVQQDPNPVAAWRRDYAGQADFMLRPEHRDGSFAIERSVMETQAFWFASKKPVLIRPSMTPASLYEFFTFRQLAVPYEEFLKAHPDFGDMSAKIAWSYLNSLNPTDFSPPVLTWEETLTVFSTSAMKNLTDIGSSFTAFFASCKKFALDNPWVMAAAGIVSLIAGVLVGKKVYEKFFGEANALYNIHPEQCTFARVYGPNGDEVCPVCWQRSCDHKRTEFNYLGETQSFGAKNTNQKRQFMRTSGKQNMGTRLRSQALKAHRSEMILETQGIHQAHFSKHNLLKDTQGATQDVTEVVKKAMFDFSISLSGGEWVKVGYCFSVVGKTCLVPLHFLSEALGILDERGEDFREPGAIRFQMENGAESYTFGLEEIKRMAYEDDCATDAWLFDVPCANYLVKRDLVGLFPTNDEAASLLFTASRNVQARLVMREHDINVSHLTGIREERVMSNGNPEVRRNLISYQCDNYKGLCGAMLVSEGTRFAGKIFAQHIAGAQATGVSLGAIVTGDTIRKYQGREVEVPQHSFPDMVTQAALDFHGTVPADYVTRNLDVSAGVFIKNTLLPWDGDGPSYFTRKTAAVDVSPYKFEANRAKFGPVVTEKIKAPIVLRDFIRTHYLSHANHVPKRIFTLEEAIMGLPGSHFDGVDGKTSAGFPDTSFGINGEDYWSIDVLGRFVPGRLWDTLVGDVQNFIDVAKTGLTPVVAFKDCLKGERLPVDKVAVGKARLISIPPKYIVVLVKMYYGAVIKTLSDGAPFNTILKGYDEKNADYWSIIGRYLAAFGDNVGAGDYQAFDHHQSNQSVGWTMDLFDSFYTDATLSDVNVRKALASIILNQYHVFGSVIEEYHDGMPSGWPLTSEINCATNLRLFLTAWLELHDWRESSLLSFFANVHCLFLGDDNIFAVSNAYRKQFTPKLIARVVAREGHVYTDVNKGPAKDELEPLSNATVLKRSFREFAPGRFVGPLDLDVVLEMPLWSRAGADYKVIAVSNQDTALRELALHGPEVFHRWMPRMKLFQGKYWNPISESYDVLFSAATGSPCYAYEGMA